MMAKPTEALEMHYPMIQFLIITSAERKVKDCDAQECFKVAFGCPEFASQLVRDIFEFFDLFLFLFITLARNIDCNTVWNTKRVLYVKMKILKT